MSRVTRVFRYAIPNRRGAVLLLFGIIYVFLGYTTAVLPIPPSSLDAYHVARDILPLPVWGWIWSLCGVFGIATAYWPPKKPKRDDYGYYVMAFFTGVWAMMCLFSSFISYAPRGVVLFAIYITFSLALLIISGMDREEALR